MLSTSGCWKRGSHYFRYLQRTIVLVISENDSKESKVYVDFELLIILIACQFIFCKRCSCRTSSNSYICYIQCKYNSSIMISTAYLYRCDTYKKSSPVDHHHIVRHFSDLHIVINFS